MDRVQKRRCAIYTRKSVEEGLEQEFNTLDAQRLAAENYIASQIANGWVCLPEHYDDGGFSGGTLDRPALKKLLSDASNGLIDTIVVYKIDRLSRSICDFAELSKKLDEWGVSFVSVTQDINTSTSAGRMMLNILITFAQYEREVITERVRDKMAASRKRGQWVGGGVAFGYKVDNRHLVPNPEKAPYVRMIFKEFVENHSIKRIVRIMNSQGQKTSKGNDFNCSHIHRMLRNHTYVGEVAYQGGIYPGEHEAIIDRSLWDATQDLLKKEGPPARGRPRNPNRNTMLCGLIRCGQCGGSMTPSYTFRHGKQYNYYKCSRDSKLGEHVCQLRMVPAGEIERLVMKELGVVLKTPTFISMLSARLNTPLSDVRDALNNVGEFWDDLFPVERDRLIHLLVKQVTVSETGVVIKIKTAGMRSLIQEVKNVND